MAVNKTVPIRSISDPELSAVLGRRLIAASD